MDFTPKQADQLYSRLILNFGLNTSSGKFIHDPSQPIFLNGQKLPKIVSEGQSWWQIIAARMAGINPQRAADYQIDFDTVLSGTEKMIALAKAAGRAGEFPAWKITVISGQPQLAPDPEHNEIPQNSASDADLDLIKSLIFAQKNVDQGLWKDNHYGQKALTFIEHASRAIFDKENGVLILRPSEDWDSFYFTDYMSPATFSEITEFCRKCDRVELASIWEQAAHDAMKLYDAALTDTGEFPGHIDFSIGPDKITAMARDNTHQAYDGIRSPLHFGEYLLGFPASEAEIAFGQRAYQAGAASPQGKFSFTNSAAADKAMYLPLVRALGQKDEVRQMTADILKNLPAADKYFENTLILLGLLTTHYPNK